MSTIIVASSEAGAGKSTIAAALAYRMVRDGKPVTLARLSGDARAEADAAVFASLDGIVAVPKPLSQDEASKLLGDAVVEAPAGAVKAIALTLKAAVIVVGRPDSSAVDGAAQTIVTRVAPGEMATVAKRSGVTAVLPEDRILAAPAVADIAAAIKSRWLVESDRHTTLDRLMIGTVASDAATPYFGNRDRKCVITRYDKTDIQLAALQTDTELLLLTGGGQPSPYLLDRVQGYRDDISVLLAEDETVDVMRQLEGLYGVSRFDGAGKMMRAAELLDEAGFAL
jgi:BioD-like phosphotransacetylase family protein